MKKSIVAMWIVLGFTGHGMAQYAIDVVSYDPGSTPAIDYWSTGLPYDMGSAALGAPERFTGEGGMYPSVVSPFSSPYLRDEIVSIGEGGHLTLRLSHDAIPQVEGAELGIFTNVALIDTNWPNGHAGNPIEAFGIDSAMVEVSPDGQIWHSLGTITCDLPTNGYTDLTDPYATLAGAEFSDYHQPFPGTLDDLAGLAYRDPAATDLLDVLAGSGGGTWLDLSTTGFDRIGWIRFSVVSDGDSQTDLNFELDAVTIAHGAIGAPTVPEPGTWILALLLVSPTTTGRRRGFSGRSPYTRRRRPPFRRRASSRFGVRSAA